MCAGGGGERFLRDIRVKPIAVVVLRALLSQAYRQLLIDCHRDMSH